MALRSNALQLLRPRTESGNPWRELVNSPEDEFCGFIALAVKETYRVNSERMSAGTHFGGELNFTVRASHLMLSF